MPLARRLAWCLAAAAVCLVVNGLAAAADTDFETRLEPVGDAAVQAAVSITVPEDGVQPTILALRAEGLTPTMHYPVRLYSGTVERPSASSALLGYLDADSCGQATLTTTTAEAGAVRLLVELSPEWLGDGQHLIAILAPGWGVVAAGQLPTILDPPRA